MLNFKDLENRFLGITKHFVLSKYIFVQLPQKVGRVYGRGPP